MGTSRNNELYRFPVDDEGFVQKNAGMRRRRNNLNISIRGTFELRIFNFP